MSTEVLYYVQIFVSGRWDKYGWTYSDKDAAIERYRIVSKQFDYMQFRVVKQTVTVEEVESD